MLVSLGFVVAKNGYVATLLQVNLPEAASQDDEEPPSIAFPPGLQGMAQALAGARAMQAAYGQAPGPVLEQTSLAFNSRERLLAWVGEKLREAEDEEGRFEEPPQATYVGVGEPHAASYHVRPLDRGYRLQIVRPAEAFTVDEDAVERMTVRDDTASKVALFVELFQKYQTASRRSAPELHAYEELDGLLGALQDDVPRVAP